MVCATVSSWSSFCWLYRTSPSLSAKNIINLILLLTIWWCPCVESSLVCWKRMFAMTSAFSWQNSISLCPASFRVPRPICLLLQVFVDFLLLHSSPLWWKLHLLWVLVLKGLVGLHRTVQLQLLLHYCLGHRLGLLWYEWFALESNRDHSVVFEIASKYCI